MEIVTITDRAKEAIAKLCNETVVVEYDMILNYPRIVDHIINFEKIEDEQLIKGIDRLGKDSLGHFTKMDEMIRNLGDDMVWLTSTLPRLVDIVGILDSQLEREKAARDIYQEARKIAVANKIAAKPGGFFSRLRGIDISEHNIVLFDKLINDLDRLISDEERHMRIVEDSIATFKALSRG